MVKSLNHVIILKAILILFFRSRAAEISPNHIFFLGHRPHDTLPDYYGRADLIVNPSLSESFGMSLIEALACGKPVVASSAGGMPEIIDEGINGLTSEPGNPIELAHKLCIILRSRDLADKMGRAGRRRVAALFDWSRIAESAIEHYKIALGHAA